MVAHRIGGLRHRRRVRRGYIAFPILIENKALAEDSNACKAKRTVSMRSSTEPPNLVAMFAIELLVQSGLTLHHLDLICIQASDGSDIPQVAHDFAELIIVLDRHFVAGSDTVGIG